MALSIAFTSPLSTRLRARKYNHEGKKLRQLLTKADLDPKGP